MGSGLELMVGCSFTYLAPASFNARSFNWRMSVFRYPGLEFPQQETDPFHRAPQCRDPIAASFLSHSDFPHQSFKHLGQVQHHNLFAPSRSGTQVTAQTRSVH